MAHKDTYPVSLDMPAADDEREITMRCVVRHFRTWIIVTSLLTLSSLMILQSMLYRITQSQTERWSYHRDGKFQKRFLGSYDTADTVRILRLSNGVEGGDGPKYYYGLERNGASVNGDNDEIDDDYDKDENDEDDKEEDDKEEDDDDMDYDKDKNPVFKEGDFDPAVNPTKHKFQFKEINDVNIVAFQRTQKLTNEYRSTNGKTTELKRGGMLKHANANKDGFKNHFVGAYTEGVYWTERVERLVPAGPTLAEVETQTRQTQRENVTRLEAATWNKCGRAKNGFVVMTNGAGFCARYRAPHQNLILGEVLSYYLSRLLGMDNVPLVVLSHTGGGQWSAVNYTRLEWSDDQIVALIRWTDGLNTPRSQVKMPRLLLDAILTNRTLHPISIANQNLTADQLTELVQWGEMIIFDYITGNYDRVASMQDGAEREHKPSILSEYIRNLRKHGDTSKFWLIDNESGLLDAYDLLYKSYRNGPTFAHFHKQTLRSTCIFKQSMVAWLKRILDHPEPHAMLTSYAEKYEPLLGMLQRNWLFDVFKSNFPQRLREVYHWVQQCKTAFR